MMTIMAFQEISDHVVSTEHKISIINILLYCMKISRFRCRVKKTAKLKCREKSFNGQPRN